MLDAPASPLSDFKAPCPTPPAKRPNVLRGLAIIANNPLRWWPQDIYGAGLMDHPHMPRRFVSVADPALNKRVLLDDAASYARSEITMRLLRPALGYGLLTSDGDMWRRQRRIASPAFRAQMVDAFAPAMIQAGAAAGARLASAQGVVDVMPEMIRATYDVMVDAVLDFSDTPHDRAQLQRDIGAYVDVMGRIDPFDLLGWDWAPRPWKWSALRAVKRLRAVVSEFVRRRRAGGPPAQGRPSLADLLIAASDPEAEGEPMDEARLVDNMLTFIAAGHETTAMALTWALFLVSESPRVDAALAEERAAAAGGAPLAPEHLDALTLHKAVVQEALRLYPPAGVVARTVTRETTLGPFELAPGDHVTVPIYPLHRRPALWDAPELFRPERFLGAAPDRFAYMPFGAGPQICIGMGFAMLEAVSMLAAILDAAAPMRGAAREVEPVLRVTLRPKGGMKLAMTPRALSRASA